MSRLVRMTDESDPSEDVMILGGRYGVVTLHMPGGHPDCMVLHSPEEMHGEGWTGPHPCTRMEMPCWCLSSITGEALRAALAQVQALADEEALWAVMERDYQLYLQRRRK
jgi:hypothetical protein